MSDKQPLMGTPAAPSAPPPPYQPPSYGAPPPPPQHAYGAPPPPQHAYGGTHTHVTVAQVQPATHSRVFVEIKPPNYVVMSVITMLFFCWIFGLIALIVGMQVDSAWLSGDRVGARRLSSQARGWNLAGMISGVIVYVLLIIAIVVVNVDSAWLSGDRLGAQRLSSQARGWNIAGIIVGVVVYVVLVVTVVSVNVSVGA